MNDLAAPKLVLERRRRALQQVSGCLSKKKLLSEG